MPHRDPDQAYYQTPDHAVAAGIGLSLVDIVVVGLRFAARKKQKQRFGWDDYLMLVATVLTVGIGIVMTYGVSQRAVGYPLEIPPDFSGSPLSFSSHQLTLTTQIEFAYMVMLPLALGAIKLSILALYMRIFSATSNAKSHILLSLLCILVVLWTVGFFLATIFHCGLDLWAGWSTALDYREHCPNAMRIAVAMCITDFIVDVILAAFPIPLIWRLNLSTRNKITATAVFSLGAVAIIASLLRLIMENKMMIQGLDPNADEILVITEFLYWGMVECGIGIFAASLPVVQSLFRKTPWFSSLIQSTRSTISLRLLGSSFRTRTHGSEPDIVLDDASAKDVGVPSSKGATSSIYKMSEDRTGGFGLEQKESRDAV